MCVIVVKPAEARIPVTHLRTANSNNPHGWGIAARMPDGTIEVRRGFSTRSLVKAYYELKQYDMVVHCRIGTSGTNDLKNTHPFVVAQKTWMFHNGIFRDISLSVKGRSDTWHLSQLLSPVFENNPAILDDPAFIDKMSKYCRRGYSNKLVFMDDKRTVIINAEAGVEANGCWYSNATAFPSPRPKYRRIINTPALATAPNHQTRRPTVVPFPPATPERRSVAERLWNERDCQPDFYGDDVPDSVAERLDEFRRQYALDNAKWEAYMEEKYGHPVRALRKSKKGGRK